MIKLPVRFKEKVTNPPSANGTGYPYRISASDLDENFAYAALDAGEGWIEQNSAGVYSGRKLKLPDIPSTGTYVLGCIDGIVQWIATEAC
jgi:hypothetical protein